MRAQRPQSIGELEVLARMGRSLLEGDDLDDQLATTLDLAMSALDSQRGSVMLVDPETSNLEVRCAKGLPSGASRTRKREGQAISEWVAANRQPVILNGDVEDPRFSGIDPSIGSALCVPMLVHGDLLGVINLGRKPPGPHFEESDLTFASTLADIASVAIEKAELHAVLRDREARVSELLAAAIGAQEAERRRIAADIHDGFLQDLTAMFLKAEGAKMELAKGNSERAAGVISEIQEMVREEVTRVRNYIFDVRPPSLDQVGIGPTLAALAERTAAHHNIKPNFVDGSRKQRLPEPIEAILYRTAQEALRNIAEHANAQSFEMGLQQNKDSVRLWIKDDGVGISPAAARRPKRGAYGIETMRERVKLAGGTLTIRRLRPAGTEVEAVIPLAPKG